MTAFVRDLQARLRRVRPAIKLSAALITYGNLALAFVMVTIIAIISSYFGVRRVLKIEPFDIFRT